MTTFTVYGSFYGSDELPDSLGSFTTRAGAEAFVSAYPDSDPIVEFDFYLIEMTVGRVSFVSVA
jgi:hypothetical protein